MTRLGERFYAHANRVSGLKLFKAKRRGPFQDPHLCASHLQARFHYLGVVPGALVGLELPGIVVPLLGVELQGTVLPGVVVDVDPGVEVGHGRVEDGTPGVVPAAPGMVDCGVAVSFVLPGGVVVCCSGRVPGAMVPDAPEFGVVVPLLVVLPGMVPVGLEGVVAAGGRDVLVPV